MSDLEAAGQLQRNWTRVLEEVAAAAQQSGRSSNDIKVIGVSKYVDAPTTKALFDAGCRDLAESRQRGSGTRPVPAA